LSDTCAAALIWGRIDERGRPARWRTCSELLAASTHPDT
jgi:hypothetical protein